MKLKKCPFCGGEAKMGGSLHVGYWISCNYCDLWMGYDATHGTEGGLFTSKEYAASEWNKRSRK